MLKKALAIITAPATLPNTPILKHNAPTLEEEEGGGGGGGGNSVSSGDTGGGITVRQSYHLQIDAHNIITFYHCC